jgi:hypothetical protein
MKKPKSSESVINEKLIAHWKSLIAGTSQTVSTDCVTFEGAAYPSK